ncbi:alpha/beta hydrolase [Ktedonosporobacter rubrisoli]|uniref:Alpha/beta hydrolase n=1 Tax=Ktedonosporobacter rubrisoli TaxID=2509675 RepID=A0A4P6JKZ1_KTERU|nr:alpha/beta hydrolase [Ktedonosporobacter rubrisoli]QBD75670.1 alpha/beta hydrolase [Ktedonosporobacter rubrisoli]
MSSSHDESTKINGETEASHGHEPAREIEGQTTKRNAVPPLGKLYDVGEGRRLMLHHAGTGTPAVVFEAGAGGFGLDYLSPFELCARRTTCVLYDRAGSGWSDPAPSSRSAQEIVTDLHSALGKAGVEGPYILVGHSLGGVLVRAYTQHFPREVVGLVLIDPATESFPPPESANDPVLLTMQEQVQRNPEIMRTWYPSLFAEWEKLPQSVRDPLIARHMAPDQLLVPFRDIQLGKRLQEAVANGPALPIIPIIVLTGMQIDPSPGSSDEEKHAANQIKLAAHAAFANSVPQGEHRVLQDAGHLFYTQRPDVVVAAVFDILDRLARR